MEALLAALGGAMFGAGVYMMLRRTAAQLILGYAMLTNAVNLIVFVSAGLVRGGPPLLGEEQQPTGQFADPLAQALVLTAIVIGFGTLAFLLALVRVTHLQTGSDDLDEFASIEETSRREP